MGCEVKWTASAKGDVNRIIRHIAVVLDSPKTASEHLDALQSAAGLISDFPEIRTVGTHPSLSSRNLRSCFVKNYVVLYSYDGNAVVVHRVFHTLQDYARLIKKDASSTDRGDV